MPPIDPPTRKLKVRRPKPPPTSRGPQGLPTQSSSSQRPSNLTRTGKVTPTGRRSTSRGPQGLPTQSGSSQRPANLTQTGKVTPAKRTRGEKKQARAAKVRARRNARPNLEELYARLAVDRVGGDYDKALTYVRGRSDLSDQDLRARLAALRNVESDSAEARRLYLDTILKDDSVLAGVDAAAVKALEQTTRPLHAIAGATRAAVRGENIPTAALRGIKNEDKHTFGSILKEAGAPGVISGPVGFAGDVALDPTTYLTGGTGGVIRKQATDTASKQAAARAATRTPTTQKEANRAAARSAGGGANVMTARERAAEAARRAGAAERIGLTIKFAGKEIPGVRRATSRVVSPKIREKVRESRVRRAARYVAADVNPNVAAPGVSREAAGQANRVTRTARARTLRGRYEAQQRAIAIKKQIGEDNFQRVIDAIEAGTVKSLPPALRRVAKVVGDLFKFAERTRKRGGVKAGTVGQRTRIVVPAVTAREAAATRRDVERAERRVSAAERQVQQALEARGVSQGRAEILSREVAGSRGERAAERSARTYDRGASETGRSGSPADVLRYIDTAELSATRYAGGGSGVSMARAAHDLATRDAATARVSLKEAKATHKQQKEQRKAELKAQRAAQRAADKQARSARGYVPHVEVNPAELTGGYRANKGGGTVRSGTTQARTDPRPLAEIRKEQPGRFSEDLPQLVAGRMSEAARVSARADMHRQLADLGRPVPRDGKELRLGPGEAVYHIKGSTLSEITDERVLEGITAPLRVSKNGKTMSASAQARKGGRFVILNKQTVDQALEGALPQMQGHGIVRGLDKVQGGFKYAATVPNPGFHIRNLIGDSQNAYLAESVPRLARNVGQSARALKALGRREEALRDLSKRIDPVDAGVKIGDTRVSYDDLAREAEKVGAIRSGFIATELPELMQQDVTRGRDRLHRFNRFLQNREDVIRLATYIGGRKRGLSPEQAAERAAKYHFDYGHLTKFERNIARRAMPFWTFSARNIPLQLRSFVTRPGKFANYQKIREEAATAFGFDEVDQQTRDLYDKLEQAGVELPDGWERYLADYEQRQAPIPISVGGKKFTISAALPLTDIGMMPGIGGVDEWVARAVGLATPIAKTPTELVANYNFFFGEDIEADSSPLVAAPAFVGSFPEAMRRKLGIVQGPDKREGGKRWLWPGRVDYVSTIVPGPPQWAQKFADTKDAKSETALAWLGVKATKFDPTTVAVGLAYERMGEIEKRMSALRQQGISADRPTPEYKRLQGQLALVEEVAYQAKAIRGDKELPTAGAPPKTEGSDGVDWGDGGGVSTGDVDWGDGAGVSTSDVDWGD